MLTVNEISATFKPNLITTSDKVFHCQIIVQIVAIHAVCNVAHCIVFGKGNVCARKLTIATSVDVLMNLKQRIIQR